MSIEKSNGFIRNRALDLPAYSIVPQLSTLPRTLHGTYKEILYFPPQIIGNHISGICTYVSVLEAGGFRHDPLSGEHGEQEYFRS
jgi:hypothetical protein